MRTAGGPSAAGVKRGKGHAPRVRHTPTRTETLDVKHGLGGYAQGCGCATCKRAMNLAIQREDAERRTRIYGHAPRDPEDDDAERRLRLVEAEEVVERTTVELNQIEWPRRFPDGVVNRYAGRCVGCGMTVPPNEGRAWVENGQWVTRHETSVRCWGGVGGGGRSDHGGKAVRICTVYEVLAIDEAKRVTDVRVVDVSVVSDDHEHVQGAATAPGDVFAVLSAPVIVEDPG